MKIRDDDDNSNNNNNNNNNIKRYSNPWSGLDRP
jgi:hypothetical protein